MNLIEIWREWANGTSVLHMELWGVDVLWWGRIGKVLQFVGALTVILDIIGPERLLGFGESLRTASPFDGMVDRARQRWNPIWEWAKRRIKPAEVPTRLELGRGAVVRLVVQTATVVIGFAVAVLFTSWGWILVLAVLLSGVAALALAAVVSFVGRAVFVLVIRPFATVIAQPRIDAWAKSVGALLLMAGFHFDLLAS